MLLNTGLIASVLYSFFNRRSEAKERRRREAHDWMQQRLHEGDLRILRSKLVAKQRQDPQSFPLRTVPLDEGGLRFLEALCLEEGEDPRPSLDALKPDL